MKFNDLQEQISKYVYTEDDGIARIALASIISTRLKIGDPVWLLIIGPSSGGKSQILRPLALTDTKFIHRVDDMTENTLLSGSRIKKGEKNISLLKRIGELGIIVISDFTVIFSKSSEAKTSILGQLRMVYDGEMTKFSGVSADPIKWNGSIGILAGSTPSIYSHFEEVADMGERFIYYRMKPYNIEKATRISMDRKIFGRELDDTLSTMYSEYIKDVVLNVSSDISKIPQINKEVHDRIIEIAMFASLLRTPTHYDKFTRTIDRVPVSEMPMRVALQLSSLAKGLMIMRYHDTDGASWDLTENDISYIEWCAYSLGNEERRACLRVITDSPYGIGLKTQTIADSIGLSTTITGINLQHLAAIGILQRSGNGEGLSWSITDQKIYNIIDRLEHTKNDQKITKNEREISSEEIEENVEEKNIEFDEF